MTSKPQKFVSRPQEIEAVQWNGHNYNEIVEFLGDRCIFQGDNQHGWGLQIKAGQDGAQGWVYVPAYHWVVRKPDDPTDYWPVDPVYFESKYTAVKE